MPWGWITRVFTGLLIWRWVSRGRQLPQPTGVPDSLRRKAQQVRDDISLAWTVVMAIAFALAGGFCAIVAGSLLTLGPRWVGVVAAVFTLTFLAMALRQSLRARREVQRRRWRKRLAVRDQAG